MSHSAIEEYFERLAAAWPQQDEERESALAELRDHVLAVYEDELDSGADEEEAAERALASCGDALKLISQFRGPSFQRRARWVMRLTTAAMVAGVLAAGSIAVFWPGEAPAPLVATAIAQAPKTPTPKAEDPFGELADSSIEANNKAAQRKLAKVVAAEFEEIPLTDALRFISDATEVETYLDVRAFGEVDLQGTAPVTVMLKKVRADMLLDLILQQVGTNIDYVIRDGIVVVTTVESLEGASDVKAYPVDDLLRLHRARPAAASETGAAPPDGGSIGPTPGGPGVGPMGGTGSPYGAGGLGGGIASYPPSRVSDDVQQLIDVIQNTVAPSTWEDAGGNGTITYYGDMLVIRQTPRTHREVEKVLKLLRDTAAKRK